MAFSSLQCRSPVWVLYKCEFTCFQRHFGWWMRSWCYFINERKETKVSSVNLFLKFPTHFPCIRNFKSLCTLWHFQIGHFHHFSKFSWSNWARIIQEERNSVLFGDYEAALILSFSEAFFYLIHCTFSLHILKTNELGISEITFKIGPCMLFFFCFNTQITYQTLKKGGGGRHTCMLSAFLLQTFHHVEMYIPYTDSEQYCGVQTGHTDNCPVTCHCLLHTEIRREVTYLFIVSTAICGWQRHTLTPRIMD